MRTKVLVICGQEIIEDRSDGGKQCSYKNYELLKQIFGKENVYLCMFTRNNNKSTSNIIRLSAYKTTFDRVMNILSGAVFTSRKTEDWLISYIKKERFDIIYFDRSVYGSLIRKIDKQKINCKKWVFMHNIEKNYFIKKARHQGVLYYFVYLIIARDEKETISRADYIISITTRDAKLLSEIYGRKSDMILPMSFQDVFIEDKIQSNSIANKKELLFIGTMMPPNYDGIKWFVDNVMPELKEYTLKIVGKGFEKKRKELGRENVQVIGYVDNIEDYYYGNNIMVIPIFYGDGIKVKTAEAMMYGKTILASNEALEGYQVEDTGDVYRCNTKEEFLSALDEISSNGRYGYSESVRSLFCSKYCFDIQVKQCKKIWSDTLL